MIEKIFQARTFATYPNTLNEEWLAGWHASGQYQALEEGIPADRGSKLTARWWLGAICGPRRRAIWPRR